MPHLSTGMFGSAQQVASRAERRYHDHGASGEASAFSVHPMFDNFIWRTIRGEAVTLPADSLLAPVLGNPQETDRWFNRDHEADPSLQVELTKAMSMESDQPFELQVPDGRFAEAIVAADRLLESTIPAEWESIRPFVTRVYDMRSAQSSSATFDHIGGAVLLSSLSIDPDDKPEHQIASLAEGLLHESAHSKSYRIFRSFRKVSVPASPEFIDVPWWRTPSSTWEWDVDRSIVACHVYTHIAVFYGKLAEHDETFLHRHRLTSFRARFLSNVLLQLSDQWLDDEWRSFVEWTSEAIPELPTLSQAGERELSRDIRTFTNFARLATQ